MGLLDAIDKAWDKLTGATEEKTTEEKPVETPSEEKTEEGTSDDKKEVSEEKKEETTETKSEVKPDPRAEKALQIYNILEDPTSAIEFARGLLEKAEKEGLLETKKAQEKQSQSILEMLKESVAEENHYMLDALGPALEKLAKVVSEGNESKVKKIESQLEAKAREEATAAEAAKVQTLLDNPKYKDHLETMVNLMDDVTMSPKSTYDKYLDTLFEIAKSRSSAKSEVDKKTRASEKIKQNLEERTISSDEKSADDVVVVSSKVDLDTALDYAFKGKKVKGL
jgi:hypothetical protein